MNVDPTIVVASVVAIIILQIVIIAKLSGLRKKVTEMAEQKVSAPVRPAAPTGDRFERKDQDFRRRGRPAPESRTNRPQATAPVAPSADPVEKSLRDINLRLKNAERDQEFARKKIQGDLGSQEVPREGPRENIREGGRDFSREGGRDRDGRGRRDDRSRGGRNDHQRRDRRPGGGGGSWQERDRSRRDAPSSLQASDQPVDEAQNFELAEKPPISPAVQAVSQIREPVEATVTAAPEAPELAVSEFGSEEMQHGRKILVKRRLLKDEDLQAAGSPEAGGDVNQSEPQNESQAQGTAENTEDSERPAEIRFGRR